LVRLRYRLAMSENLPEAEQQAINRDISQLEALIDELLTYARLDRPQVALNLEKVNLGNWLTDKVDDFSLINADHHIELTVPQNVDFGGVDLRLMERVLDNLVNNALRYAHDKLRISLWLEGEEANLQVEDDGPGIPEEERLRIFEPFVRLDPSRDRATGGCGLGLAIVHSIAVAYQGRVTVEASPSLGGACIRFTWPIKAVFNLNTEPR